MSLGFVEEKEILPPPLPVWALGDAKTPFVEDKDILPPPLPAWALGVAEVKAPFADVKISNLEVLRRRFLLRRSLGRVLDAPPS
jgi:hypothetical protein